MRKTKLKMQINATITEIKYHVLLVDELKITKIKDFDINTCPTSCIYSNEKLNFAVSKWVSPKGTSSYFYQRVYNRLANEKNNSYSYDKRRRKLF